MNSLFVQLFGGQEWNSTKTTNVTFDCRYQNCAKTFFQVLTNLSRLLGTKQWAKNLTSSTDVIVLLFLSRLGRTTFSVTTIETETHTGVCLSVSLVHDTMFKSYQPKCIALISFPFPFDIVLLEVSLEQPVWASPGRRGDAKRETEEAGDWCQHCIRPVQRNVFRGRGLLCLPVGPWPWFCR